MLSWKKDPKKAKFWLQSSSNADNSFATDKWRRHCFTFLFAPNDSRDAFVLRFELIYFLPMNIFTCEDDIFEWYIIGIKSLQVPQSSCIKIRKTINPSRQYYASLRVLFSAEQKKYWNCQFRSWCNGWDHNCFGNVCCPCFYNTSFDKPISLPHASDTCFLIGPSTCLYRCFIERWNRVESILWTFFTLITDSVSGNRKIRTIEIERTTRPFECSWKALLKSLCGNVVVIMTFLWLN